MLRINHGREAALLEINTQAGGKDMKENNKLKLNIQTFAEGDGGSEGGAAGAETKPEAKVYG